MFYDSLTVAYAPASGSSYGNYVDLTSDLVAINVVKGIIPVRPLKEAEGPFSNETDRVEFSMAQDDFEDLSGITKGAFLKLKLDNGAIVKEEEMVVSAVTFTNYNSNTPSVVVQLSPKLDGVVTYSLHAE